MDKKKKMSKGDRLNWVPLQEAKTVKPSFRDLKPEKVTSEQLRRKREFHNSTVLVP